MPLNKRSRRAAKPASRRPPRNYASRIPAAAPCRPLPAFTYKCLFRPKPDNFFAEFSPRLCAFALKTDMLIFLNGQIVPEEQAVVSIFDRGFLYGDGLFETMLVFNGKPFRWAQHLQRLQCGAEFLKIKLPFTNEALRSSVAELVVKNQMPDSLLRLTLSRGVGVRGYSPKGAERPTLVMSLHPAPPINAPKTPGWRLITSSFRLPAGEPLAQFKTCNKLPQVLARAEADAAGADE